MEEKTPLVSIGLPVYNGEKYLRAAIDSILAQTFPNFELIISDNASIDRTEAICNEYASKDSRIRYSRNATNIGGANNHNKTVLSSKGKYFRFAAYDDVCAPELLAKSVEILEQNASIVNCYSILVNMDENGNPFEVVDKPIATSPKPYERFRIVTNPKWHGCESIYGLIRSDILFRTSLLNNYTDADRTLLCELSLYGQFYQVPEPLFYRRVHPDMSTIAFKDWRQRMAWSLPDASGRIYFPSWLQFLHYFKIIASSPLDFRNRAYCYLHLVHWLLLEKGLGRMIKDLYFAVSKLLRFSFQKFYFAMGSLNKKVEDL